RDDPSDELFGHPLRLPPLFFRDRPGRVIVCSRGLFFGAGSGNRARRRAFGGSRFLFGGDGGCRPLLDPAAHPHDGEDHDEPDGQGNHEQAPIGTGRASEGSISLHRPFHPLRFTFPFRYAGRIRSLAEGFTRPRISLSGEISWRFRSRPLAGALWEAKAEKAWEGALAGACGGLGTRARRGREAFGPAPFGGWDAAPPKMRCRYPRCAPPELLIPEPASGRLFFHSKVRSTTRCTDSPVFSCTTLKGWAGMFRMTWPGAPKGALKN